MLHVAISTVKHLVEFEVDTSSVILRVVGLFRTHGLSMGTDTDFHGDDSLRPTEKKFTCHRQGRASDK